jgi:hypothetical protein
MGQPMSVPRKYHVSLADYPEIANDTYTVERTSGEVDSDWRIPAGSGIDMTVRFPAASIHAMISGEMKGGWRIFMDNGPKNSEDIRGGWRRIGTIWPTRLHGDPEAIEKWRNDFLVILEELEKKRHSEQVKEDQAFLAAEAAKDVKPLSVSIN